MTPSEAISSEGAPLPIEEPHCSGRLAEGTKSDEKGNLKDEALDTPNALSLRSISAPRQQESPKFAAKDPEEKSGSEIKANKCDAIADKIVENDLPLLESTKVGESVNEDR